MSEVRRTRHFFSSITARNNNGRFEFTLREPIFYCASVKIKKWILANFVGIGSSAYYFLRTDAVNLTRDSNTLNGVPSQVVAVLPYSPHTPGLAVDIAEEDDSEAKNIIYSIQNLWFEIIDQNGNVINPPDVGWSFCVELQIVINSQTL